MRKICLFGFAGVKVSNRIKIVLLIIQYSNHKQKKKNVTCQVFHFSIYKFHPKTFCYQCFCYLGQFDCWCLLKIPGFMNILCVTKMLCNPFKLSIISNNWRTVAICFLIFIDVTKWGFLKLAYKHNSCTTSHPGIRFTERLVVQANKYYLLQLQPLFYF